MIRSIRCRSLKSLRSLIAPVAPSMTRSTRLGRFGVIDFAVQSAEPLAGGSMTTGGMQIERTDRGDDPVDRAQVAGGRAGSLSPAPARLAAMLAVLTRRAARS